MKRKSPFGFLGFSLATIALCALALYLFAVNAPDSVPGENLLEWQYNRATDKNAVLQEYRARIWAHGGGTVPDGAARFFAARLDGDTSHVQNEVAAIARFYASQSGMREGNFGQLLSEKARQRLVDAILRDWRTYPEKMRGAPLCLSRLCAKILISEKRSSTAETFPTLTRNWRLSPPNSKRGISVIARRR